MNEPKFQFSIFDKNHGYDGQWVVRADTFTELIDAKNKVMTEIELIKTNGTFDTNRATYTPPAAPRPSAPAPFNDNSPYPEEDRYFSGNKNEVDVSAICPVHNVPLEWKSGTSKKTGRAYGFFACPRKMPNGDFCQAGSNR